MTNQANTIWIKGFSADGFQVSVTLAITDAIEITSVLEQVREQGIMPTPPAPKPATERMTINSVTRRLWTGKDGKEKHALDFFVDHLQWRVFTVYMDSMDDIEAFERGSGLQIGSLPVLPMGAPPERNPADKNQIHIDFDVLYNSETNSEGKRRDTFIGYANEAPAPAPSPKVTPMPAPKRAKDDPSAPADDTTPKHPYTKKAKNWTEDRAEADNFNKACRLRGLTPINVLAKLEEGKRLVSFREISLTKEQAYARLAELSAQPAVPADTADIINEVIESRDKAKDQAPAAPPLAGNAGTLPAGFSSQNPPLDVPF